ncbi:hypothetical protein, partial [Cloacibacterium rupense]|uniref:hypothetical protein n=1 Tax=Cloacibacterium rupense TaxID=517423 RepID=UPI00166C1E6A
MENSKKLILFSLILFTFISCHKNLKECQECKTDKDSLIFVDRETKEVYIRLKAIEYHPKLEEKLKANNYYSFYNSVNIYSLNKSVNLSEIIDQKSFK